MARSTETSELHPVMLNQQVVDVVKQEKNPATDLMKLMIAANGVVARMLEKVSSLRRIEKPERWDRIVQLAAANFPPIPIPRLSNFFFFWAPSPIEVFGRLRRKSVLEMDEIGGAGLHQPAVSDASARLIKAMLASQPATLSDDELAAQMRNNCGETQARGRTRNDNGWPPLP